MSSLKKRKKLLKECPWIKEYVGSRYTLDYPDGSLYDMIKETSLKYPNNIAYSYFNNNINYTKFHEQIVGCAKALKNIGVQKGDVVAVCTPNTPEALLMFYGANMIGAIVDMIHPLSSENEINFYLNASKCVVILTIDLLFEKIENAVVNTNVKKILTTSVSDSMDMITGIGYWVKSGRKNKKISKTDTIVPWPHFMSAGSTYLGELISDAKKDSVSTIMHSGGTTGTPKGILLTNGNINTLAFSAAELFGCMNDSLSILAILPFFHGFGLACSVHVVLCNGAKVVIVPKFESNKFDQLLSKNKPSVLIAVPTLLEAMINNKKIKKMNLSFLQCVISGGDVVSVPFKNKVDEFLSESGSSALLRPGYGMTECVAAATITPIHKYKEGSIGIPMPDVRIKIVKVNTHEKADFLEEGEICISGPTVMQGYLNDPKETASVLQLHEDGLTWLHSGDLGYMDSDGFVYFSQRLKRMIVSGGFNIYPGQIEEVIETHSDVLSCTVIGIDHQYKVQVAKAFIVLRDNVKPNAKLKKEIKELCEKNVAKYSLPYEYEFRESLPTTLIGKVAYKELEKEEKLKNGKK